jgi:hypothetical protein
MFVLALLQMNTLNLENAFRRISKGQGFLVEADSVWFGWLFFFVGRSEK